MSAPDPRALACGSVPVPRDRFPGLSPSAYALIVEGDAMRPRFSAGDVLVIDPEHIPKPGDFVVLWPSPRIAEHGQGDALGTVHAIVGSVRANEP